MATKQVDAGNAVRQRHNADMAENAQIVKGLVVQAEDARILGDMKGLKARYALNFFNYIVLSMEPSPKHNTFKFTSGSLFMS